MYIRQYITPIQHKLLDIFKLRNTIIYGMIGVSAVFLDMSLFFILFNFLHIHPVLSTIISVTGATSASFFANVYLNFKTKDFLGSRLVYFFSVSLLGLVLSALSIYFFTGDMFSANIVKVFSLPPIVALQYILNSTLTFRVGEKKEVETNSEPVERAESKRIAVIGAGFTGLTAAYELSKAGHSVTVYESEPQAGGLVSGFEMEGVPLERAYHFLYKTDSDIISLAEEIGVKDKLHFHSSSLSLYYEDKLYPFMTPKDLLKFTPLNFFQRVRAGLVALYLGWQTRWGHFSKVTAMDWMNRAAGKRVTKVIWEPILRGKFFDHYDKIAMSYVWSRVYVRANSRDKGDVTEKLGYFDGGFKTFIDALVDRSKANGVNMVYGAKVKYITEIGDKVQVSVSGKDLAYDSVLATTPSHVFAKMIESNSQVDQSYLDKLESIDYLGAVLMVFATDEKFTDYYWHNINDEEHPFLVLLSLSALVGTERLDGKHIYYIGAYVPHGHRYFSSSKEEIKEEWIGGVKKIFPDFDELSITDSEIFRFKNAQHIVDLNYKEKIPDYKSPVPGVFLSNFSQIFPDDRGVNYAVKEGKKVSNMILDDLKERDYESLSPDSDASNREDNPDISIVLPTFNESRNIGLLLRGIEGSLRSSGLSYECIFVDDSTDQTADAIVHEAKSRNNIFLIKRRGKEARSGLTQAFYRGFESARGKYILCMDTDLQHPPEKIPEIINSLEKEEADVAVASRYMSGGKNDGLADGYRKIVSRSSNYLVWLLLPRTRATSDPMTGFFAFRNSLLDQIELSSSGFKILVEILSSKEDLKVTNVPFNFGQRIHGGSKANFSQGIRFIKDVWRLFIYKDGNLAIKYFVIGTLMFIGYVGLSFFNVSPNFAERLGVSLITAEVLILLLFYLTLAPVVFGLLFIKYGFDKIKSINLFLIFVWITLNLWIFVAVYGSYGTPIFLGSLLEGIFFSSIGLLIIFTFRPLWTRDLKSLISLDRWFAVALMFAVFITVSDFLSFDHWLNFVLFFLYLAAVLQGMFALYMMLYRWESEENFNESNRLPDDMLPPYYSFTIIVPCKHEKMVISDTLRSLNRIDYPRDLTQILVVIHESSDDGTIEIARETIKELGAKNIKVVTYDHEPVNKPSGLNFALTKATGGYVAIFDAEDEPHPDLLRKINTFLLNHDYDVLQSGVQLMNYKSSWYSTFNVLEYYFWFKSTLHFFAHHKVVPLGGVTVFFRKDWLERIGGWDERCLTEDAEIGIRLSVAGAKIGVAYEAKYATQEEAPHTLWGFVKQRTRWAQGFFQILLMGHWRQLPTLKAKVLAIYILAWPLILLPLALIFPLGIVLLFVAQLPPALALFANIPLLLFCLFIVVQIIGLYEFCCDYNEPFPWLRIPLMVFTFYFYILLLVFSGTRAIYRQSRQVTSWEKTEHLNLYRKQLAKQDLKV